MVLLVLSFWVHLEVPSISSNSKIYIQHHADRVDANLTPWAKIQRLDSVFIGNAHLLDTEGPILCWLVPYFAGWSHTLLVGPTLCYDLPCWHQSVHKFMRQRGHAFSTPNIFPEDSHKIGKMTQTIAISIFWLFAEGKWKTFFFSFFIYDLLPFGVLAKKKSIMSSLLGYSLGLFLLQVTERDTGTFSSSFNDRPLRPCLEQKETAAILVWFFLGRVGFVFPLFSGRLKTRCVGTLKCRKFVGFMLPMNTEFWHIPSYTYTVGDFILPQNSRTWKLREPLWNWAEGSGFEIGNIGIFVLYIYLKAKWLISVLFVWQVYQVRSPSGRLVGAVGGMAGVVNPFEIGRQKSPSNLLRWSFYPKERQ